MSDNYNNTNKKVKDLILIISGPSGSGKGTVIDMLIEQFGCRKAVSVTTRNIRPGEIDGRDYKFVTRKKFDDMLKNGELLEYNIYGDNCYGTPKYEVEEFRYKAHLRCRCSRCRKCYEAISGRQKYIYTASVSFRTAKAYRKKRLKYSRTN